MSEDRRPWFQGKKGRDRDRQRWTQIDPEKKTWDRRATGKMCRTYPVKTYKTKLNNTYMKSYNRMCVCVIYIGTYKYITYTYRRLSAQTLNFAQIRHFRTNIISHLPWNHFLPFFVVESSFSIIFPPPGLCLEWWTHHVPPCFMVQSCFSTIFHG